MMSLFLVKNKGAGWRESEGFNLKAYSIDHEFLSRLKTFIFDEDIDGLKKLLKSFNRNFSLVFEGDELVFAAVDHVRSFPLFYCSKNGFQLSDSGFFLADKNHLNLNRTCVGEFLSLGNVIGKQTIYDNLNQLEAGSFILYKKKTKHLVCDHYFQFKKQTIGKQLLVSNDLHELHTEVFSDLVKELRGRQVVIPLSGGYDSRLIAYFFQKLGHGNILTYTYGSKNPFDANAWEVDTSRKVAKSLGLNWVKIDYSKKKWQKLVSEIGLGEFYEYVGDVSSFPEWQEWLAVHELKNKGLLELDAVFIPGHSYDFLAGNHLQNNESTIEISKSLWGRYYRLAKSLLSDEVYERLKNQLENVGESVGLESRFENWIWKERQSKWICNSVRNYEFHGYEWRMSLWDMRLIEFWMEQSDEDRMDRKLFKEYVREYLGEVSEIKSKRAFVFRLFSKLTNRKLDSLFNNFYGIFKADLKELKEESSLGGLEVYLSSKISVLKERNTNVLGVISYVYYCLKRKQ